MKKFLIIVVLGLLWCNTSFAKSSEGLKGLRVIDLVVENANDCGVTTDDIERAVKYILSNSKIKIKKDVTIEALWIAPNIIESSDFCSGNIYLEIYQIDRMKNSAGYSYIGRQVQYSKGHLVINNKRDFRNSFLIRIELMIKDLVIAWSEVN